MTMTNAEYWRDRALQRERQAFKLTSEELAREVKFYYETSIAEIQKEIAALYGQFAKENKISLPDARRLIRGKEFRTWRMSLKEYIKASKADPKILRELNTLAMRTRINRLEMLEARTLMVIADLSEKLDDWLSAKLYRSYVEANYGNLYDIGQTAGFYTPPIAVDPKQVEDVIKTPWSGKNYSARIWANGLALSKILRQTVLQNVHRGTSIDKLSRNIAQKMNTAYSNAERLVRTELNYVHNRAAAESIKAADFAEYQFVAVLDARTTPICQSLDGEHFPLAELEVGENAPPMHVRCRSTIIAYDGELTGKRTARDSEGKRIKIPAEMNYRDWKAVYIDKTMTFYQWQKSRLPNPTENDIINKLPEGDYNLKVRQQVQNRHIEGTNEYIRYVAQLAVSNQKPSILLSDVDVSEIVREFHGTGIYNPNPKDNSPREIVDVGRVIGKYWNNRTGKYEETSYVKIVYSKKGVHIYPVRPSDGG